MIKIMVIIFQLIILNNIISIDAQFYLGLQIHDTCGHVDLTQQHLYDLISTVQNAGNISTNPRLIGKSVRLTKIKV